MNYDTHLEKQVHKHTSNEDMIMCDFCHKDTHVEETNKIIFDGETTFSTRLQGFIIGENTEINPCYNCSLEQIEKALGNGISFRVEV